MRLTGLADIPAGYLSAGQKRRLGLARLAAAKRPVWLSDEPTVSLDTASVALLVAAIDAHVAGGGLAVIATHIPMALARAQEIRLGPAEGGRMRAFCTLVQRDLRLAVRQGGALGTALGFYMIVVTLLPLGLGADLNLLSRIAPGVLWIALLLSALLSLPRMFGADYEDGSLDILATGPLPLELVAAAKALGALDLDRDPADAAGARARHPAQSGDRRLPGCWWRPCWSARRP